MTQILSGNQNRTVFGTKLTERSLNILVDKVFCILIRDCTSDDHLARTLFSDATENIPKNAAMKESLVLSISE